MTVAEGVLVYLGAGVVANTVMVCDKGWPQIDSDKEMLACVGLMLALWPFTLVLWLQQAVTGAFAALKNGWRDGE